MSTIKRPVPKVYDYLGAKKAEIHSAFSINEKKEFGNVSEIRFKVPQYLIDGNGNIVPDEFGQPQFDPRINALVNEFLVEFNGYWYVIKDVEEGRDISGVKIIDVYCEGKEGELSFKQVKWLNLSPPFSAPVDPRRAILEVITYPYQLDLGYGNFSAVSSNLVTLGVTTSFDFTGGDICILSGNGAYQQRRIVAYNTSTKQATLDSAFSPQVNTSSLFRIHNSKFLLGDVDSGIITVDGQPVRRALAFEDSTIQEALFTIRNRFSGNLVYSTEFNPSKGFYYTSVGLKLDMGKTPFQFRYKKNLKGVKRKIDSTNGCYTRLYPEGRNNLSIVSVNTKIRTDSGVTYNEHEFGKGDMFNFQYWLGLGYTIEQCRELFVKDFRFIEDAYVDPNMLYEGAKKALEDLSLPEISYTVDGVDLSVVGLIPSVPISSGDIIDVIDEDLGFNFSATVMSLQRDWDKPFSPRVVLSNFTDTIGDIYLKILKYNEGYSGRKSLYGKATTVIIADQATSRNWRHADYIIPEDGSVPANVIIQHAIDEVSADGGGEIFLMDGQYLIKATMFLKDNVEIKGSGISTRFFPFADISMCFRCNGIKNVKIESLYIDYARQSDGISILNRFSNGIGVYDGSDNVTVRDCIIETIRDNYFIAIGASNLFIEENIFRSVSVNSFPSDVVDLKACTNASIRYNTIEGAIRASIGYITITDQVGLASGVFHIEGNFISVTHLSFTGMTSSGSGGVIFCNSASSKVFVNNNTIINKIAGNRVGIRGASTTGEVIITNNRIDGNFRQGILIGGIFVPPFGGISVLDGVNVRVLNNVIKMTNTESSFSFGIEVSKAGTSGVTNAVVGNTIQNNDIKGQATFWSEGDLSIGVYLNTNVLDTLVSGNDLKNSGIDHSFLDQGTGTMILGGNKL